MNTNKKIAAQVVFLPLALFVLAFLTGCCGGYRYESCLKNAEEALKNKSYEKAKKLYSTIYAQESKAQSPEFERVANSFYRLGVIAEVQERVDMAIGYYWGDSIDEGYYSALPRLNWLAQTGRKRLEEGKSPRALEEILLLEQQGPPQKKEVKVKIKKTKPLATYKAPVRQNGFAKPRATHSGILTPPPLDAKGPFEVFH